MSTYTAESNAVLAAVLAAIANPPKPGRIYYTCEPKLVNDGTHDMPFFSGTTWTCEAGRRALSGKVWVDICKFQPDSWHRYALSKKLGVREVDVSISLEKPSVKK